MNRSAMFIVAIMAFVVFSCSKKEKPFWEYGLHKGNGSHVYFDTNLSKLYADKIGRLHRFLCQSKGVPQDSVFFERYLIDPSALDGTEYQVYLRSQHQAESPWRRADQKPTMVLSLGEYTPPSDKAPRCVGYAVIKAQFHMSGTQEDLDPKLRGRAFVEVSLTLDNGNPYQEVENPQMALQMFDRLLTKAITLAGDTADVSQPPVWSCGKYL